MNNPRDFQISSDVIPLVTLHKAGCSPEASQFGNYSSSRILLASNEYLTFGSCTNSTWVNNILEDTLGIADTSVKCEKN